MPHCRWAGPGLDTWWGTIYSRTGFLSLNHFDTLHFINVEGLLELQNAKENVQGTVDHNYNLQKGVCTTRHPETLDVRPHCAGEPGTSEGEFQLAGGLTQLWTAGQLGATTQFLRK